MGNKMISNWSKVKQVVPCDTRGNRTPAEWRKFTVSLFFNEEKGTGLYYYAYRVEQMTDGSAIFLMRPTWKWGLDYFIILQKPDGSLEGPQFDELERELLEKKEAFPESYLMLNDSLLKVHAGFDADEVLKTVKTPKLDSVGLPVENILKIAKWLFIDEDIKYWGHGGRDKWKNSIEYLAASSTSK